MKTHCNSVTRSLVKASLSLLLVALSTFAAPAKAADGCTVLLCLAGNWKNISPCVPQVREAMRDAARRGGHWPRCEMQSSAGAANGATGSNMTPAFAPGNCPAHYTTRFNYEGQDIWSCRWTSVVDTVVNGQLWSRVWFDSEGNTSTEYLAAARAQLTPDQLDPTFDRDLAVWVAEQEAARLAAEAAALANCCSF